MIVRVRGEKNIKKYGGQDIIINNPVEFPDVTIVEEYTPLIYIFIHCKSNFALILYFKQIFRTDGNGDYYYAW